MKISMKKMGGVLVADNQQAIDTINKIKENSLVMVDVKQSRNIANHRRFFKFLSDVLDMQEVFDSTESLRFWLIMKAGYIDCFSAPNGTPLYKPQSMDFASMDEIKFKEVFSRCIDVVLREFKLDKEALDKVVDYS